MNKVLAIGLTLFILVITGIYLAVFLEMIVPDLEEYADIVAPLVVFTGFFLFLIGAFMIALFIHSWFMGRNKT